MLPKDVIMADSTEALKQGLNVYSLEKYRDVSACDQRDNPKLSTIKDLIKTQQSLNESLKTAKNSNNRMTTEQGETNSGAPSELLLEFLDSVMYRRFDTALILCRKIIELEPDNYQARAFLPMLEDAHSMKSKGYFNPLMLSSDSESEESSGDARDRRTDNRAASSSSSSSAEWDYSTTTSESSGCSENEDGEL
ncbi:Glutamate-rich protein 2 [Sparganum proliferum]